jgi:hypothetical protein
MACSLFGSLISRPLRSASGWKFLGELRLLKLADQRTQTPAGRGSTLPIKIRKDILRLVKGMF